MPITKKEILPFYQFRERLHVAYKKRVAKDTHCHPSRVEIVKETFAGNSVTVSCHVAGYGDVTLKYSLGDVE